MAGTNHQEQQNAVPKNPPPQNAPPQNPPSQNDPPQNPSPQANQPGPRPNTQRGSSNSEAEDYPTEKRMVAVGALGIFAGAAVGVAVGLHQGKKAAGAVTPVTTLSLDQLVLLGKEGMGNVAIKSVLRNRLRAETTMKEMMKKNNIIEVLQKKNGKIQPFTLFTEDVILDTHGNRHGKP